MKWTVLIFFFVFPLKTDAQLNGARNIALANTFLTHDDIASASNNISKLPFLSSFAIGISSQNQFTLKELQQSSIAIGIPLLKGYFSFNIQYLGFQLYNTSIFSIAYGIALSPQLSLGLKINYMNLSLGENLGRLANLYPDLALNYRFPNKVELSILLNNITLSGIRKAQYQYIPISAQFGINYTFNEKLILFLESAIALERNVVFRAGIEYKIHSNLYLRIGGKSNPSAFSFGFGLAFKRLKLDFASSYQSFLGFSPALTIRYE